MNVATPAFAGFVVVVFAAFHALPARRQTPFLVLVSYAYYASWSLRLAALLAAVTVTTWLASTYLAGRWRLALGVAAPLAALVSVRLAGALPGTVHTLTSEGDLIRVIGVAYFTLQAIGFVVDRHRGLHAEVRFEQLALHLAWFPKLTSGPVEPAGAFLAQLRAPRVVDEAVLARAATLVALGLFRKLVIGGALLAFLPDVLWGQAVYSVPTILAWSAVALGMLYADFAGYSDLVRGFSLLFGLELTRNFRQPLLARNVSDFWLRWHVSLGLWLRAYVHDPLSRWLARRRRGGGRGLVVAAPPAATMVVCALWHRFSVDALAWGAMVALVMIAHRALRPLRRRSRPSGAGRLLGVVATMAVLVVTTLPLVIGVGRLLELLHRPWASLPSVVPVLRPWLALGSLFALDVFEARRGQEMAFVELPLPARAALLAALFLGIALTAGSGADAFVYQGF